MNTGSAWETLDAVTYVPEASVQGAVNNNKNLWKINIFQTNGLII